MLVVGRCQDIAKLFFYHPYETATRIITDTGLRLSLQPFDSTKANLAFETQRVKAKSPY